MSLIDTGLNMFKIYIDGQYGTSGLRLSSLIEKHPSLSLIRIAEIERRNVKRRKQCFKDADLVVLCLPNNQVNEAFELIPDTKKVIDCGVTFRSHLEWIYGLPELGGQQRNLISNAKYVANPGCFALAFILVVRPLIDSGYLKPEDVVSVFAVNGYSAGGQRMIKYYESGRLQGQLHGLNQEHKHIPEMMRFSGLNKSPMFIPSVGSHKEGLVLTLPVPRAKRNVLLDVYAEVYQGEDLVTICGDCSNSLSATFLKRGVEIYVNGTENSIVSVRMSNLLKGAAGTVLQNINLMLGMDECLGIY
jgi:N-acetyl-gamma-glutamyl-phosphate reductase